MDSIDLQTAMAGVAVAAAAAAATFVLLKPCQKPSGTRVCAVTELAPGNMKEVKVGEQAVLLVHTADGNWYATGAKCTHYGASLAKGVLSGNRVVCPLHAACFNVCTGDIEDGPVLDAIATFPVQVTPGGDVFVAVPDKPVPSKVTPYMCKPHPNDARHFVVIGAGPAAAAAVETLRHGKFHGKITLVTKEAALPYDRTKLSKNMAIGPEEVALRTAAFWRDELSVDVRLGAEVVTVDPEDRSITLASGEKIGYEKLLVASGGPARTFRAPESFVIPGADAGRIFPLRETAHSEGIEAAVGALGVDAPIVIVGSSFIGMEAAAYLRKSKGCTNITVVGMETEPFERVLGPKIGAFMRAMHEAQGVKFRMGAVVSQFKSGSDGNVSSVVLKDGKGELPAKLVVVGSGIIPALSFMKDAAAKGYVSIADKAPGGLKVDEFMEAGRHIYAAGDVAYFPYHLAPGGKPAYTRIEHYDVAMDQGRVAAKGMMGWKVPLRTVPFFWTAQYGKSLRYAGHAHATDNVILHGDLARGDKAEWTAFFVQGDAVAAVATFNRDPEAVAAMELLKLGAMPAPSELASASAFDLTQHLRTVTIAAANKKKAAGGK